MKRNRHIFYVKEPVLVEAVTDILAGTDATKHIHLIGTWGRPKRGSLIDGIKITPVAIISRPDKPKNLCYGTVIESTGRDLPEGRPVLLTMEHFYGDTLALSAKLKFPPLDYD